MDPLNLSEIADAFVTTAHARIDAMRAWVSPEKLREFEAKASAYLTHAANVADHLKGLATSAATIAAADVADKVDDVADAAADKADAAADAIDDAAADVQQEPPA